MPVPHLKTKPATYLFVSLLTIIIASTSFYSMWQKPIPSVPVNPLYLNPSLSIDERVTDLLSYMTLEEKIGQMTLIEKNSLKQLDDISNYSLGALLSGSGAKPAENTVAGWKKMTDTYKSEAKKSRLGIPLLYGSDAIHGHAHVEELTVFPHMIGLGAAGNPELVKSIASATAKEMEMTGVNWNFAPNLDTPQDIRWGRGYETFSDDPILVAKLGSAYVEGLQSVHNNQPALATPKHFIGLGGMQWNSSLNKNFKIDQGVTPDNETILKDVYLPPFATAIEAGALSIMAGLNTWGDDRMVRQKYLLTNILKKQLGFKGFIVSDWYGVHEGTHNTFLATVAAVNAGVDMVMLPFDYETFIRHMKWANRLGLISDDRINDAVSRILYAKFSIGLFDTINDKRTSDTILNTNRGIARDAVAETLVLLKNENAILPIKANTKTIRVAGSAADNVGKQSGAWTVEWQGIDGNWLPESTSILAGIKEVAGKNTNVEFNAEGLFPPNSTKADIGIAVVGESPYAEGWGDNENPAISTEDLAAIKNLQLVSKSVIVILVTGRPLIITNEIQSWDAVVTAWLPGSEGAGVADVLFGKKPFTGTLPLPWPASIDQLPISTAGKTKDGSTVLFPRYFGLKY